MFITKVGIDGDFCDQGRNFCYSPRKEMMETSVTKEGTDGDFCNQACQGRN
jgi:hypothetical protein